MSWFTGQGISNQLTNFKDQITTFTKDVLTETTHEIDDPVGELRLAKQRIDELEKLEALQRDEQDMVKRHKDELSERAETAEFQIATLSQEYRKLLQEKEEQVQNLKEENVELKEQLRIFLLSQEKSSLPRVSSQVMVDGITELHANGMDSLNDLISCQDQINTLSALLTKTEAECQYWKELASHNTLSGPDDVESITVQLQELKRQLAHEQDQHQRELSALQHVHDEKIQSLKRRHQTELEQQQSSSSDTCDWAAKSEELENLLNESTQQFQEETHSLRKSLEEKERALDEQEVQLKADTQSLAASLATCQERVISYQARIEELQIELQSARNEIDSLNAQLSQEKRANGEVCSELDELRKKLTTDADEEVAKVKLEREQLSEELSVLQQKIVEQINVISDLEQTLNQVNVEMEQSTLLLAARETDLATLQTKKEEEFCRIQHLLNNDLTEVKLENDLLKVKLKEVMGGAFNMSQIAVDDESEKMKYIGRETDHQYQIVKKDEQVQTLTESLQDAECLKCSHFKETVENLQMKLDTLQTHAVLTEKELTNEIKMLQEDHLTAVSSENSQLQLELNKKLKEVERLKTHLLQVEQENNEQIVGFQEREEGLQLKLVQTEEQLSILNSQKDSMSWDNQQRLDRLTEQLCSVTKQRDSTLLQLNAMQMESEQLHQQVTNLQIVLEEFQKEQSSEISSSKQVHEKELTLMKLERNRIADELDHTKRKLNEILLSVNNMQSVQQRLESKELVICDLKQQVETFQQHLMSREHKFSVLNEQEENRVDKDLVKNLLLGYFSTSSHKKAEVLKLITSILEFTPTELEQVNRHGSSGWISNIWRRATPPPSPATEQASFSKLFIKFLENESAKQTTQPVTTGYIDPHTDPDKPLFTTATMVTPTPSIRVATITPSLPTFEQITDESSHGHLSNDKAVPTSTSNVTMTTGNTSQSFILSELLNTTHVQ